MSTQEGVDQAPMKSIGLLSALERDGMFLDARCAEIIDAAADGEYEQIVVDASRRNDRLAGFVEYRTH